MIDNLRTENSHLLADFGDLIDDVDDGLFCCASQLRGVLTELGATALARVTPIITRIDTLKTTIENEMRRINDAVDANR